MLEQDFQRAVLDLAKLGGWKCAHFRPALTKHGWRTPVSADGKGFPDLVLTHPRRGLVLFRELKTDSGPLQPEQIAWLGALRGAGADADTWRPRDLTQITEQLLGRPARRTA